MPWAELAQGGFAGGMNLRENKQRLGENQAQIIEEMLLDGRGMAFVPLLDVQCATSPARVMGLVRHYGTQASDKRLLAVSNGNIYRLTDSNGLLGAIMSPWQSVAAPVRFLRQQGSTYFFDGASAIKAYDSATHTLIDPVPTTPTDTVAATPTGSGPLAGYFSYKITAASAMGESNAGNATAAVGASNMVMNLGGFTARPAPLMTKIYRAFDANTWNTASTAPYYYIDSTHGTTYVDFLRGGAETGALYLDNQFSTTPTYGVEHLNRAVWAKDTTIYVSDPMAPSYVRALYVVGGPGNITGLASLDSLLVIFKATCIYALTGNTTDDFTVQPLRENFGCSAPCSIVEFENNVFWMDDHDNTVRHMDASGTISDIGRQLEPVIQAFPRSRLNTYAVGGFYNHRYYLSLDDGTTAVTYVYDATLNSWTRLKGAYSAYASLANPHDTDFSGLLSVFMAGADNGVLWQVQESASHRTTPRIVTRAHDGGDPYSDKLYRKLRLDVAGNATGQLFMTAGSSTTQVTGLALTGLTEKMMRQAMHGPAVEGDLNFVTDGNAFTVRGYFIELFPRVLR